MTTARAFEDRAGPGERRLRAEAEAIGKRHPHILDASQVSLVGFIQARKATVAVTAAADGLRQFAFDAEQGHSALFLDPASAYALFRALDDAVSVCGCGKPLWTADAGVCVVSQETLCEPCRRAHCHGTWHESCNPSGAEL